MVVYLRKSIHSLLSVFKKKAGPKCYEDQKRLTVHYTPSQHYQENVFIEGSRPQYLEDLHTEAQEGLKILQQEEHKNGVNFPDNESIASTDTLCPEDISSKDRDGSLESGNTDTTVTSTVLTGPVLTRQGSTFKPPNPVKRLDKTRKRSRRTTIMGIPNQVQKELALHRSSTFQPLLSAQLPNHERNVSDGQSGVVIIPTVDGGTPVTKKEGARVHLSELEAFKDEHLMREHLQSLYQDKQSVDHQSFGSRFCPTSTLRPKSLAVPGMTTSCSLNPSMFTFLQEPQGPVMSISPQATYLSTIIPNAILPASIEVIEIDRGTSRTRGSSINHGSSTRTVSKSSLTTGDSAASPLLSRGSDGDGSQTHNSHDNPTLMSTSTSGSNWSESQSSKTIISNSSPVSSKGSTRSSNSHRVSVNVQESQAEQSGGDQELVSLCSSASVTSNLSSKNENTVTGPGSDCAAPPSVAAEEHAKNKRNFTRSLSVMKTKQPPAPPRRTNSLHNNKIRSTSMVLVDSKDLSNSASGEATTTTGSTTAEHDTSKSITTVSNSTGSPDKSSPMQASPNATGGAPPEASPTSPQKTFSEGGMFERTMSPSSGYSSQSGTPTLSPKDISPNSPDKQKKTPVKPERSVSRASSAASPSSSLTSLSSGTSELANADLSTGVPPQAGSPSTAVTKNNPSSFRAEIRDLLNIPPPPKVKAPCPPPPETWAHNRHTVELLCGPYPNVSKVTQKQDSTDKRTDIQPGTNKDMDGSTEKQITSNKPVLELTENKSKTETLPVMYCQDVHTEQEGTECPDTEQVKPLMQDKTEESVDIKRPSSSSVMNDQQSEEVTSKKEPPPVMKKPTTILHREEAILTEQQKEMASSATTEAHKTSSQNGLTVLIDENENELDRSDVPSVETLSVEIPKIHKVSPPPTPPPAYHPTPPLSRKSSPSCVSVPPNELQRVQEEVHIVESSWPPPPPPLEGDSVFDGGDEVDFPPPPPPDSVPDAMNSGVTAVHDHNPPSISQSVVTEDKPAVVILVSDDKASCQNVSSVSESISPPHVQLPPVPPVTIGESPVTVTTVLPPDTVLKRNSLKTEDQSASLDLVSIQSSTPTGIPVAPPLPAENLTHGVNFRRQPSVANRDARSKELLSRHKSAPIPKEDANIPLVTPSLLQMVRLRSVNMTEDQVKTPSEDKSTNEGAPAQNCPVSIQGSQNIPQKPIRKSLSLKSPPQTVKTASVAISTPSMRLQEAIRIKTAAMSSRDSLPCRLGVRSPTYSCMNEPGALSLKPPEGCDMLKSSASTASFIFSRSTKRVVIETAAASSSEAQANLKQSLAAELMQVSDQSKAAAFSNGGVRCDKVPPPVAKKPALNSVSPSQNPLNFSAKMELGVGGSGAIGVTPPEITTTRVTADTIETLF